MPGEENAFCPQSWAGESSSATPPATGLSEPRRLPAMASWAAVISFLLVVAIGVAAVRMAGRRPKRTLPADPAVKNRQDVHPGGKARAYRPTRRIAVPHPQPLALAVGKDDRVYLACQDELLCLTPGGSLIARLTVDVPPQALAIAPPGSLLPEHVIVVGGKKIQLYTPELTPVAAWTIADEPFQPVAVAAGKEQIYLVNAALGEVLRINFQGQVVGRFAGSDPARGWPGLVLPSLRTDLAVDAEGRVFLANPGLRRVEVYTAQGVLELYWGEEGTSLSAFFGCCNPQHLTLLPNGHVVTSEKGLLRIKEMSAFGELVALVAGEDELNEFEQLRHQKGALGEPVVVDIAADSRGGIWALYPGCPLLLYFEPAENSPFQAGGRQ